MNRSCWLSVVAAVMLALFIISCAEEPVVPEVPADAKSVATPAQAAQPAGSVSKSGVQRTVFASGLLFPRGLRFGPDGNLYVAEAGMGGTMSTDGQAVQVIPPVGPYTGGFTARISKINRAGERSTVVDGLPSAVNQVHDVLGVADVEFLGRSMYALSSGGGSSHGFLDIPASVIRVDRSGRWSMVANLSRFQRNHPVAHPEADDFEPDGSWYSMIKVGDDLFAVEPNHGELDKVDPANGRITRIADISQSQGHIVPTAVAYHRGYFYVGNLNPFPVAPGSSRILRISLTGHVEVWKQGFTTILGLAFDRSGRLHVLESITGAGFPFVSQNPGAGRVVRVNRNGANETVVDGLFLPTGMTFGPDGALYVSNNGFGPPGGEILRFELPSSHGMNSDQEGDGD